MKNKSDIYIIGINGGKKGGRVGGYLKTCLDEAEKLGVKTKIINLSDYNISSISKVAHDPENDSLKEVSNGSDMEEILKEVYKADGIIFASPVHWFAPSSEMKLFIDRLTPLENSGFLLEGKVSGFIVYGNEAGKMNALMQMTAVTNHMGMFSPPYAMIYFGKEKSGWAEKDLPLLAHNMTNLIKAITRESVKFVTTHY